MVLVKNTQVRIVSLSSTVHLRPGVNEVDDDVWDAAVKGPKGKPGTIAAKVKSGELEVVGKAEGKAGAKAAALEGLDQASALSLIAETYDREALERWVGHVKDAGLHAALVEQIAKINAQAKTSDDDEEASGHKSAKRSKR